MGRSAKTSQLQIRVSPEQKIALKRAAARAGMGVSAYVMGRLGTATATSFAEIVARLGQDQARFALAELNALLTRLTGAELRELGAAGPGRPLDPYWANYLAAMFEQACARRGVALPAWVRDTPALAEPVFGTSLQSLRLYLLANAPAAFRRRNIFIDSSIEAQV